MKIGLGSDKYGYQLKEAVKKILRKKEMNFFITRRKIFIMM